MHGFVEAIPCLFWRRNTSVIARIHHEFSFFSHPDGIRCVPRVSYLGSYELGRADHNKLKPSVSVPFCNKSYWRWHLVCTISIAHACLCAVLMRQFPRHRSEADSVNVGALLQQALQPAFGPARFLCVVVCAGRIFEIQ